MQHKQTILNLILLEYEISIFRKVRRGLVNFQQNVVEIKRSGFGPILSERSCIRNRSWVGRAERELVSRKDGDWSGRAGFERGCIIRDTARYSGC